MQIDMQGIQQAAHACFPQLTQGSYVVKYQDDEGDMCTLTEATFPDFISLHNEKVATMKVELVPNPKQQQQQQGASQGTCEQADAEMGGQPNRPSNDPFTPERFLQDLLNIGQQQQNEGVPQPPWAHFLQHILNVCMHGGCAAGATPSNACPSFEHLLQGFLAKDGGGIASLLLHFGPHLAQCGFGSEVDKLVACKPELVSDFIKTIRESIDPFPQLQETHIAIDKMMQMNDFTGLGSVAEGLLP